MDFQFNIPPGDLVYDIETFPNVFTAYFEHVDLGRSWYFEISPWRNDLESFICFIAMCRLVGVRWIGFNNLGFDYPVCHFIFQEGQSYAPSVERIYQKAMDIIETPWDRRFDHVIWERDQLVPQVDLYKVHHFDNQAKTTSLKALEFCLRAIRVQELPFPVGTVLNREQTGVLKDYNINDVTETKSFARYSRSAIAMRDQLSQQFNMDMTNCSDVKIGEKILVHDLERKGVKCHAYVDGRKKKLQTHRKVIHPRDIILDCVEFDDLEFNRIHTELLNREIPAYSTKGVFDDLVANVDGVEYKFGTGGLHGSVENAIVRTSDTHQLVDVDVASYYPNLAIANNLYPEHLGPEFCSVYEGIYRTRKTYKKGTPENEAYKLALNGSYGLSNNIYSVLYDPQYMMSITLNGQLLLAMLVQALNRDPDLQMIQANTDGVTFLIPHKNIPWLGTVIEWWQNLTGLELEESRYQAMFIRDVNSYIALKEDGKVKRIGAYAYETAIENPGTRELPWHKDWSFRVVQMAAEAYLLHGTPISQYIRNHRDLYDFFGRTKVNKSTVLELDGKEIPGTIRYYISYDGGRLEKVMPAQGPEGQYKRSNGCSPGDYHRWHQENGNVWCEGIHTKNKSTYERRRIGINTGWNVAMVNHWNDTEWDYAEAAGVDHGLNINYDFYIREAEKLVNLREYNYDQ